MEMIRDFKKELSNSFLKNIVQKDVEQKEVKVKLTTEEIAQKLKIEREERRKNLSAQDLSAQDLSAQDLSAQRNKKSVIKELKDGRFSVSVKNKKYNSRKSESKSDFYKRLITIIPESFIILIEEPKNA